MGHGIHWTRGYVLHTHAQTFLTKTTGMHDHFLAQIVPRYNALLTQPLYKTTAQQQSKMMLFCFMKWHDWGCLPLWGSQSSNDDKHTDHTILLNISAIHLKLPAPLGCLPISYAWRIKLLPILMGIPLLCKNFRIGAITSDVVLTYALYLWHLCDGCRAHVRHSFCTCFPSCCLAYVWMQCLNVHVCHCNPGTHNIP